MKLIIISLLVSSLVPAIYAQQELGGLEKVRLQISSYLIRNDSLTSAVPQFNFQSNQDRWQGVELNTTTETAEVTDWDAVNTCAQAALNNANANCYYLDYYEYICGFDPYWGSPNICYGQRWQYDFTCGTAVQSAQQAIIDAIEDGTHSCVTSNTVSYPQARNDHYVKVEPGIDYTLDISAAAGIQVNTAFLISTGYLVFIKDDTGSYVPSSTVEIDFTTDVKQIEFQIREQAPKSPGLLGQASNLFVGDLKWELGLGVLGNGDSAGRLVIHEEDLTDGIFTRSALKYYLPISDGVDEVEEVRDGQGLLRQIKTPTSFVDLVDVASVSGDTIRYEVRMYSPLASTATKNTSGLYETNTLTLLVKYAIGRESTQSANDFSIKQYDGSNTLMRDDSLTKYPNGSTTAGVPLNTWAVLTTATSGDRSVNKSIVVQNSEYAPSGTATGIRLQVLNYGQDKTSYDEEDYNFVTQSLFRNVPDIGSGEVGEVKVYEGRLDTTGATGKGYSYYYILDPAFPAAYGQRYLSVDAWNGWKFINYNGTDNSIDYGESTLIIEPGDDLYDPANFLSGTSWSTDLSSANNYARYITTSRVNDFDGLSRREAVVTRSKNTGGLTSLQTLSQQISQPTFIDVSGEKIEVQCNYTPYDFQSATDRRNASYTAFYTPNTANSRLIYKPYFTFAQDKTKSSFGYYEGTYRGVSDAFVTLKVDGYHTGSLAYSDTVEGTAANQTHGLTSHSHEGLSFPIDEVILSAGKSTKEVTVRDARGQVRFIEKWIYNTGSQWKQVDDLEQSFTGFGQLTEITQNGRIIYEAQWNGIRKDWEKDEAGIKVSYEYDGIGRVIGKTVSGNSGEVGIPTSRTTSYFYDARDRMVVEETVVNAGDKLVEKVLYDAEGYVISETDKNGLTTEHTYVGVKSNEFIGMKRTSTFPDTTYKETYIKQNGEIWKEILYQADDTLLTETENIYSDNVTPPTGSDLTNVNRRVRVNHYGASISPSDYPYEEKFLDASGLVLFEQKPSAAAGVLFQRKYSYDSNTGQKLKTTETEVSENGSSTSLTLSSIQEYDLMGMPSRSGVDVDGDGSLVLTSSDRIIDANTEYVTISSEQWSESTTTLYPEEGANTAVTSSTRTKLTGLTTNQLSVSEAEDVHGSVVSSIDLVDRASNKVTTTTTFPDTTTATKVTAVALLQSQTNRQGHLTSFEYDGAGRLVTTVDSRGISEEVEYTTGKNQILELRKDVSSSLPDGYATSFTYHPDGSLGAGLLASETNSQNETTYRSYHARGGLSREWGSAALPQLVEYDDFGRVWKQHTFRSDEVTGADFSGSAWPSSASSGDTTVFLYDDASGLLTSRTDAANRETSFTYDARSNPRTTVSPSSLSGVNIAATASITKTYTYHSKTGEMTGTSYNDGGVTPNVSFTHHRNGSLKTVTDGAGTRSFYYDFSDGAGTSMKLIEESLPSAYSVLSNLASNDSNNTFDAITYQYEAANSATSIKGRMSGYSMGEKSSNAGSLSVTDYQNAYSFTSDNRLDYLSLKKGTDTLGQVDYTYLADTHFVETRSVDGSSLVETRGFDTSRDLLASIKTSYGANTLVNHDYQYDSLGRRDNVTQSGNQFSIYGGQVFTDLGYDSRNRLTQYDVHQGSTASGSRISGRGLGFTYDTVGNRLTETKKAVRSQGANGSSTANQVLNYLSNPLNQYTSRQVPNWTEVSGVTAADYLVTAVQGTGITAKGYRADRSHEFFHAYVKLREEGETDYIASQLALYTVDVAGGSYDAGAGVNRDRISVEDLKVKLQSNSENFTYDARGNLAEDGWFIYSWDAENRLIGVEHRSGIQTLVGDGTLDLTPTKLRFKYDHLNRRYSKESFQWITDQFDTEPNQQTLFYYDGWNLLEEVRYNVSYASTTLSSAALDVDLRYYWGLDWSGSLSGAGGVGGMVAMSKRDAGAAFTELAYPSYDGTGNVMGLYLEDGTEMAQYEYSAYGEILREIGDWAEINPFRFQTKQFDQETELTYYQNRYYSASQGRFLSQDPMGTDGGINLYAFVNNSPLNSYDFLGLYGVGDFFGGIGSAIGSVGSAIWGGISGAGSFAWDNFLAPTFDFFYTYAVEPAFDFSIGLGRSLIAPQDDPANASIAYQIGRSLGGSIRTGASGYISYLTIPFRWASRADYSANSGTTKAVLRDLSLQSYSVSIKRLDPDDSKSPITGVELLDRNTGQPINDIHGYKLVGYSIHKSVGDGAGGVNGLLIVLQNQNTGHTVGSYRGTSGSLFKMGYEWRQDAIQALGINSEIYNWAIDAARKADQQYEGINFTGHSLGGGLSQAASAATGGNYAYIFNSAGVHPNTLASNGIDPDILGTNVYGGNVSNEILNLLQDFLPIPSVSGQRSMSLPIDENGFNPVDLFRPITNHRPGPTFNMLR